MSRAKRVAASEVSRAAAPLAPAADIATGLAVALAGAGLARRTGFAATLAAGFAAGLGATLVAAGLCADINLVPLLDHLVFAQLELAVGDALPGLHVVFIAVPRTHEMQFGVGEIQPLGGLVGH